MKKIIYKISVFSQCNFNAQSPDILLDFTIFDHVFNIKERFSNFKKIFKDQSLLYSSNVIFIKR